MKNKFAERMKLLRKQHGLSQKSVAKSLGISQALLSHYEKGIRECGLDFLIKAAQVYGVSTDYLLGVSDNTCGNDEITKKLLGKDKLLKGRNEVLQAINILYAIVATIENSKIHNDFNNILYSFVYYVLRVLQACLSDKEDELFKIPTCKCTEVFRYLEVASLTSIIKKLDEKSNKNLINGVYLSKEFPSCLKSLTNIIETVENYILKQH